MADALYAFFSVSQDVNNLRTPGLVTLPMIGRIVEHIKTGKKEILEYALRCVESLSAADDCFGLALVQQGVLNALEGVIGSRSGANICASCLIISNLAAAGEHIIEVMLKQGVYSQIQLLLREDNLNVAKEAVWVVNNTLLLGDTEQVLAVLEKGIFELCLDLLGKKDTSIQSQVLKMIYEFSVRARTFKGETVPKLIEKTLQERGGFTRIELLSTHMNSVVSGLAERVLKIYEESEDIVAKDDPMLVQPAQSVFSF